MAVAECPIINKYGSNKILEPFMTDLHKLEQVYTHFVGNNFHGFLF